MTPDEIRRKWAADLPAMIAARYIEVPVTDGRYALTLPELRQWNGTIAGHGPKVSLLAVSSLELIDGSCTIRDVGLRIPATPEPIVFRRDPEHNPANFNRLSNVIVQGPTGNTGGHIVFEASEFSYTESVWFLNCAGLLYRSGTIGKSPPPTNSRHVLMNVGAREIVFEGNTGHVNGVGLWVQRVEFRALPTLAWPGGGMGRTPGGITLDGVSSDAAKLGQPPVTIVATGFAHPQYPADIAINGRSLSSWQGVDVLQPVEPSAVEQVASVLERAAELLRGARP